MTAVDKKALLTKKLAELKLKHEVIEKSWKKAGNKELLQFFVDIIPRALDAQRCSIFIHDPDEQNVWVQCGTGLKEKQISVPQRGSIVGEVIASGKWQIVFDLEETVGTHSEVAVRTGFNPRNAICVPVHGVTVEGVTGAIQVLNKNRGAFTAEDREILERLAYHLQMNIENIFLRQEMAKLSMQMEQKIKMLEKKLIMLQSA
jgi:GAF domain-containing protein